MCQVSQGVLRGASEGFQEILEGLRCPQGRFKGVSGHFRGAQALQDVSGDCKGFSNGVASSLMRSQELLSALSVVWWVSKGFMSISGVF